MTGSRSLGSGISVVSLDTSDEAGLSTLPDASSDEEPGPPGVNSSTSSVTTTPCSLVTMSLIDGRDGTLMAYDDKTLITVSHELFDVSQGIVPTIVYQG